MKRTFIFTMLTALFTAVNAQNWELSKKGFETNFNKGIMDSAFYYAEKGIIAAESEFGKLDMKYATAINNLALAYKGKGDFLNAEKYFKDAIQLKKDISGDKTQSYANSVNGLAGLFIEQGNFNLSEPLLIEALNIYKNVLGNKHASFLKTLKNLANVYANTGLFEKAEPLYEEALTGMKEVFGNKNIEVALCLNGLAQLYYNMGLYDKAEGLYLESSEILKISVGENHPLYAKTLNNLGSIYNKLEDYTKAEPLFQQVLSIQRITIGNTHPDYGRTLNSLASLYNNLEYYDKAEPLFEEALALKKSNSGEKTPSYANSLNGLARLQISVGDFDKAEPLLLEALQIRKDILGDKHPDYINNISDLATLYYELGQFDKAEPYFKQTSELRIYQIQNNFGYLSEKEKEKYMVLFKQDFDKFNNFVFHRLDKNPSIAEIAYNNQLAIKGLIFATTAQLRNKILAGNDTNLINAYNDWLRLKELIGKVTQADYETDELASLNIDSLENIANQMEKSMGQKSETFANELKSQNVVWNDVQKNLKADEAAIEFIEYQLYQNKHFSDTTFYAAIVILPDGKSPKMFNLCTFEKLSKFLLISGVEKISEYVSNKSISKRLYKTIWQPFDSLLVGKNAISISMSGLMNKIAFNVLIDDKDQFLLDKYDLKFINSTRSLVGNKSTSSNTNNTIALFGGIKFDLNSDEITKIAKSAHPDRNIVVPDVSSQSTDGWVYLDGTLVETTAINKMFEKATWKTLAYFGENGSEDAFKALSGKNSPSIIHLSTHGYFFPDPKLKKKTSKEKQAMNVFQANPNPLYRSGLIMAGGNRVYFGNQPIDGLEDGVLTAYEVSNTFLGSTDLVVLSACETGLGDIKSGEGVYGLQRSFQIAGAKSVIMSLWAVPDEETTQLMEQFYQNYLKTNNLHQALRDAQKQMAKKYKVSDWAAFIMLE